MPSESASAYRSDDWNRMVQPLVGKFVTDRVDDPSFHARVQRHTLGDLRLVDLEATAHTVRHDTEITASAELFVGAQISGQSELRIDGLPVRYRPGDVFVAASSAEMEGEHGSDYRSVTIGVPPSRVPAFRSALDSTPSIVLQRGTGLVDAYTTLIRQLSDRVSHIRPDDAACALWAALDLAQAMLSVELGDTDRGGRNRRSVQVGALHRYIVAHLSDPELSVGQVAAAHYVSTRYVQTVFAEAGETVAGWIRDRRVAQACRDLVNPSLRHLPVAAIGARLGFVTPSHFGQVFREATGSTPNAYRFAGGTGEG